MALQKIKFKRGLLEDLPALDIAEPGFVLDTNDLYVGGINGNILINSVKSVNNKSGIVTLTSEDIGAAVFDHTHEEYLIEDDVNSLIENLIENIYNKDDVNSLIENSIENIDGGIW